MKEKRTFAQQDEIKRKAFCDQFATNKKETRTPPIYSQPNGTIFEIAKVNRKRRRTAATAILIPFLHKSRNCSLRVSVSVKILGIY